MRFKTLILYLFLLVAVLVLSEFVNYLFDPSSQSSGFVIGYFTKQAIIFAKKDNFDKSMFYLRMASNINTFGKYDPYRKLLRPNFSKPVLFPDDPVLKNNISKYLSDLDTREIIDDQDHGMAWIFYNLGLVAYDNNRTDLTPILFERAMYNYPEFPTYHVELINYYFSKGQVNEAIEEMTYCLKFVKASGFCKEYQMDSINSNSPLPVGYMYEPIKKHYLGE